MFNFITIRTHKQYHSSHCENLFSANHIMAYFLQLQKQNGHNYVLNFGWQISYCLQILPIRSIFFVTPKKQDTVTKNNLGNIHLTIDVIKEHFLRLIIKSTIINERVNLYNFIIRCLDESVFKCIHLL